MNPLLAAIFVVTLASTCGCQRSEIQPPPMQTDVLSIQHMEFGLEQFKVDDACCNLYKDEDGIWEFVVNVSTNEAAKRSAELEDVVNAKPHFEATALLHEDELDLVEGKIIVQNAGYDYKRDENLSNIYYFSHESIEDLRIEFIEVADDWIDAELSGRAIINGSSGNQPDAKISLRARFKRDKDLRRGIT